MLLKQGLEPLLTGMPWLDEIILLRSGGASRFRSVWECAKELRQERFDLGICMPDSISSALLLRLAGVKQVVGYNRGGRAPLLHLSIPPLRNESGGGWVSREEHVLGLVEAVGCPPRGSGLELFTTEEERAAARQLFQQAGVRQERPLVLLAPGASYGSSKCWPASFFAKVGSELIQEGCEVALVGSPVEKSLGASCLRYQSRTAAQLGWRVRLGHAQSGDRKGRPFDMQRCGSTSYCRGLWCSVYCVLWSY